MAAMTFAEKLENGQIGESLIARWLNSKGWAVLPVYDIEMDAGKGPRLFAPEERIIAPDMFCYRAGAALWIEAKHKRVFSFYGKTRSWVTGIDLRHYEDYLKVADTSPWPVWLLFLHKSDQTNAKDVERWNAPRSCPTGLFAGNLSALRKVESHRSDRHAQDMVYWAMQSLKRLASLEEVTNQEPDTHWRTPVGER